MNLFKQYGGLRKEIYILFLGKIVTNMGSMIWPVLTLILNQKLGMNATQVALITIVSGAAVIPATMIGGKLADKYNKKTCIVICDIVSICFFIICGFLPLTLYSIALLIFGSCFQRMEEPMYQALVADMTSTKDRERAYSLSYLGANLGLVASPTIAGLLFVNYLWLSFIISGLAIAVSTVLIFFFMEDITPVKEEAPDTIYQEADEDANVLDILKANKLILVYIVISALYFGAYGQYGYLMSIDISRIHGETGAMIYGSVASLNCIVVVLFTPLFTNWFKRFYLTTKNLMGECLLLIGYVIFLVFLGSIPFYYVAMVLFTFGEILSTLAMGPYMSNRIPASHRGRINGVMNVVQNVIYAGVMYLVGNLYDNMGNVVAWEFIFGILIVTIVASIGLKFWDKKVYSELAEYKTA